MREKEIVELLEKTVGQEIDWHTKDGNCFDSTIGLYSYIICKYIGENDKPEISFNKTNRYGNITGMFHEYQEEHNLYPMIDKLFLAVCETSGVDI